MAGRRTNLALLLLLVAALASGTLAFGIGSAPARVVAIVHGVVGLALVVLSRPKGRVVRRGLARRGASSAASLVFGVLVVATVLTGVAHAAGWLGLVGAVRTMQVHVGAALAAIPLGVWHIVARPARPRPADLSRRALLRGGAVLGGGALLYAAGEGVLAAADLPGASRRATGSHETGSGEPAAMPVTQWIADAVPAVDAASWRLRLPGGSIDYERLRRGDEGVTATLDCTGGWYAIQEWSGIRLDRLLGDASGASSIVVRSLTGYSRRFPVADAARLLLATRAGSEPLSAGHGFPARLVAPGRRGFWWVKWVASVELDDRPWWWQPPFPLQ